MGGAHFTIGAQPLSVRLFPIARASPSNNFSSGWPPCSTVPSEVVGNPKEFLWTPDLNGFILWPTTVLHIERVL